MEPNENTIPTSAAEPATPEAGEPAAVPPPGRHDVEQATAAEPDQTIGKHRRFSLPPLRVVVMILLVAAVLVESVLLFRTGSGERARTEAFDTSRRFLVRLTTYNSSTLDAQRREVLELATGRFRTEYTQLTGPDFIAALRDRQADSKGTVSRLAVTSLEGDNASVLAIVEVSVTNKDLPAPNVERNVIELSLVRTGSGWRVDAVSILGTLP
jgi:Mce-associated membrane protein